MKVSYDDKLHRESRWLTIFTSLFLLSAVTGVFTGLTYSMSTIIQLNWIGHSLLSGLIVIPSMAYIAVHFTRTLSSRRFWLIFSGLLISILFLVLLVSGFYLAVFGQSEQHGWAPKLHAITAYSVMALLLLHILGHYFFKDKQKRGKQKKSQSTAKFITVEKSLLLSALVVLSGYGIAIVITAALINLSDDSSPVTAPPEYAYDYGNHPFRPSQTETVTGTFIKTEQIAKSEQCGACHQDIYQQWLSSTHRQAASDPAYVKNINLLEKNRGISATRYCEGCHAPVALLSGELTPGGKHGGVKDTPAHLEGVGCVACHGISKLVHLNGVASYEFDPKEHYLFDGNADFLSQKLRNFLIRIKPEQHKKDMGHEFLPQSKLCASCHEQFMDESMNNWGWVKMQSEYTHWLDSPFSGQNEQVFQTGESINCQGCHFPKVAGSDPSADKDGFIKSHRSLGANTVLPFLHDDQEQLQATIRFLQSAKVLVDIEEPYRKDAIQNRQFLSQDLKSTQTDNTPYFLYIGERARLKVTVTNRMVGHSFPGGTTDINQAWLYFKVSDADDQIIYESGALDDQLILDKSAHTYHSIPVDRHGQPIWKHDLFRMVGDSYKNVIMAGKSDIKEYQFTVPAWAKEPLTVTAILKYRKFNQRYAQWALNHPKPVLPVVDMARDSLTIPIKVKPVVEIGK